MTATFFAGISGMGPSGLHDRAGPLGVGDDALDLGVVRVADDDDVVPLPGELLRHRLRVLHVRAGAVHHLEAALLGPLELVPDGAVGADDDGRSVADVADGVHRPDPLLAEPGDRLRVVDDRTERDDRAAPLVGDLHHLVHRPANAPAEPGGPRDLHVHGRSI